MVATKFGIVTRHINSSERGISGRPEYVRACCEQSPQRFGVAYIDLDYQHRVDPRVPIEETVGAMAGLVRQGKVRHLGRSEAAPATVRRAHRVHPIAALQSEYSLWNRDPGDEILPTLRELGIALVAYSPLGRGFLAGRFHSIDDLAPDDWCRGSPRFQGEDFARNLALVHQVEAPAGQKGCTPSQLALARLLAQGPDIVPIPGTSSRARLEENGAAVDVPLSRQELERIASIAPVGAAAGERYSAAVLRSIADRPSDGRETKPQGSSRSIILPTAAPPPRLPPQLAKVNRATQSRRVCCACPRCGS